MPCRTRDTGGAGQGLRLRGSHPLRPGLPARSPSLARPLSRSHNPGAHAPRFGLARVRSPLLAGSLLFSSPRGTEMFHFPRSRPPGLCVQPGVAPHKGRWVPPFGHPRIKACLPLPVAYRSLPRPSSPRDAKASIVRPYALGRAAAPSGRRRGTPRYVATLPFPDFGFQRSKKSSNRQHPPQGEILMPLAGPRPLTGGLSLCRPSRGGGRAWNRTGDLVLIRDAL